MESILLRRASAVVTQDEKRRIIFGGDVLVEDGRVSRIGRDLPVQADEVLDAAGKIVMPGLINTHTHIAMTLFRGVADDMELMRWLTEKIWPLESNLTAEDVRAGAELGMLEALRGGTTTVFDMYFYEDSVAEAATRLGIRGVLASSYIDAGTPESEDGWKAFEKAKDFVARWRGRSELITPSLGPHAPYSVSRDLLEATAEAARELAVPIQIHVAEDRSEIEQIEREFGVSPVRLMAQVGLASEGTVMAHVVWPREGDIKILAESGALVSHNPVSNLKTGAGISPVPELIEAGVNVGLGTDGAASNNSLDMFETMKFAALLHKGVGRDPRVVGAQTALDMATRIPADAMGMRDLGRLEEGARADVITVSIEAPWWQPVHSVISHLVYSARCSDVSDVIVGGRIVIREGRHVSVDADEVYERAAESAVRLLEKGGVTSLIREIRPPRDRRRSA